MSSDVATTTSATAADNGKGARLLLPAPPTQDLIALYALCGGSEEALTVHLAKIRGVPPEQLAPTVHSWLVDLKASGLPPPSRQRSAPSILAPNVAGRIHEAGTTNNSNQARAGAMRPLPQSAAADLRRPSGGELTAAMRALDKRLNRTPVRQKDWSSVPLPRGESGASLQNGRSGLLGSNRVSSVWQGYPFDAGTLEQVPEEGPPSLPPPPHHPAAPPASRIDHEADAASRYLRLSGSGRLHSINKPPDVLAPELMTRNSLGSMYKYPWAGSNGRF